MARARAGRAPGKLSGGVYFAETRIPVRSAEQCLDSTIPPGLVLYIPALPGGLRADFSDQAAGP